MKTLVNPTELENQEQVPTSCDRRESCDWAWRGNSSPSEDEDILF